MVFFGITMRGNQIKPMVIFSAICDASKKTFNYSGRSERLEQWAFWFATAFVGAWLLVGFRYFGTFSVFPLNWFVLLSGVWLCLANVSLIVRRLHDHGLSGFLLLIPIALSAVWMFGLDQVGKQGSGLLEPEMAGLIAISAKWGVVSVGIMLLTMCLRQGDKGENKYGLPV